MIGNNLKNSKSINYKDYFNDFDDLDELKDAAKKWASDNNARISELEQEVDGLKRTVGILHRYKAYYELAKELKHNNLAMKDLRFGS